MRMGGMKGSHASNTNGITGIVFHIAPPIGGLSCLRVETGLLILSAEVCRV